MERYVAVDNVCAWPNLTLLPDGGIAAAIFNQPVHGRWEGDVDCWASEDDGAHWAPLCDGSRTSCASSSNAAAGPRAFRP